MLHRITPEPPRPVTVEDVAFRLASEAGRRAEPRARRGFPGWNRGWAPVLAAASVFAVAGASAGGMWGAQLINRQTFTQDSLVGGANSLYAISPGYLDRINPVTGEVVTEAPYTSPVPNPPVVTGSTVWVVSSYGGGSVVLRGYDGKTLAQV